MLQRVRTTAPGTIRCSNVSGQVVFAPPLTTSGGSSETVTVSAHLGACQASDSDVSDVSGGTATATITVPTSSCTGLIQFPASPGSVATPLSSRTVRFQTRWSVSGIGPTSGTFSGFAVTTEPGGAVAFAFPGQGHTVRETGSFSGTDNGTLSTVSVVAGVDASQIVAGCSQPAGLSSISIASGELTSA